MTEQTHDRWAWIMAIGAIVLIALTQGGRTMSYPLTDRVRLVWKQQAEAVIAHPESYPPEQDSLERGAQRGLRYEATLQAKDAQIEALLGLLERARATTQFRELYEEFGAAIKEATNAS